MTSDRSEPSSGRNLLETPRPVVLEVVPPPLRVSEAGVEKLLRKVGRILAGAVFDAVNIPEIREEVSKSDQGERKNPFEPRVEPRELGRRIQEQFSTPVIVNRVVVHHPRAALADWFRETREEFGIRGFVLVGGEKPPEHYPGPSVPEANGLLREAFADVRIGNITIPGRTDGGPEWGRLQAKLSSGADFFTSQIVYRPEELTDLVDDLVEGKVPCEGVPILLSVCPVKSLQSVPFLRWLGVVVPDELVAQWSGDADRVLPLSIDHLAELWARVEAHVGDVREARGGVPTVGLNIAPVGPIPSSATIELTRRLTERSPHPPTP